MRATQGFGSKETVEGRNCADVWEKEKFGPKAGRREILGGEEKNRKGQKTTQKTEPKYLQKITKINCFVSFKGQFFAFLFISLFFSFFFPQRWGVGVFGPGVPWN